MRGGYGLWQQLNAFGVVVWGECLRKELSADQMLHPILLSEDFR